MSFANISVVGNLVRVPEQVHFTTGRVKTNVVVAVNNPAPPGKDNGTADFYQLEMWGKLGDLACKYLNKGNQIAVSGRFQLDHWKDREGKERITPVIKVAQLALPPRLRVVANDDLQSTAPGDEFAEQAEAVDNVPMTAEPTSEYVFDELEEPPISEPDEADDFPAPTRRVAGR